MLRLVEACRLHRILIPQYITIQQGDIVEWNCVQGTHNIDGQQSLFPNNPESFSYALNGASSPWDFSHTFNTPGVYDYECSMSGITIKHNLERLQ